MEDQVILNHLTAVPGEPLPLVDMGVILNHLPTVPGTLIQPPPLVDMIVECNPVGAEHVRH